MNDSFASLKHCLPKGIPMTVMQKRIAEIIYPKASQSPRRITQMMFPIALPVPLPGSISFPKGKSESLAILKHCKPNGMPITVTQHNTPEISHPMQLQRPTRMNHKMFPKRVMFLVSFQFY